MKMMKIIYVYSLLAVAFCFCTSTKDYDVPTRVINEKYENLKDSAYIYINNNDSLALSYLLRAFEEEIPQNPYHLYDAAALAGRLGLKQLAFAMLDSAVTKGYSFYGHMKNNNFFPALDERRFNFYLEQVKRRDALLHQLSIKLDSIFDLDQNIRTYYENEIILRGIDVTSLEAKAIQDSMKIIDRSNLDYINKLVDKYGFLGRCLKTSKSKITMYLVYLHAPLEVIEKRLDCIKDAVKRGELEFQLYPYFEDKIFVIKYGVQKYGTQYNISNGEIVFVPLIDSLNVDKYRSQFKLGSYKAYKEQIRREIKRVSGK